jgi:hypothetical protein
MNRTPHRYANATRIAAHSCAPVPSSLARWMDGAGTGGAFMPVLQ